MYIVYRTKDRKDYIVAECEEKEEAERIGKETFSQAEKGETVTMIQPDKEGISFSSDGQIVGKYRLYEFWH